MPTSAVVGQFKFEAGTNASPSVLTELEEVLDISGFGETNELIDVTNWDSAVGTKEFVAGLAEGDEFTVECNYVPNATHQVAVRAAKGSTLPCRVRDTSTSPESTWSFDAVYLGYGIDPNVAEQNRATFTFKISGGVTEV